MRHSAAEIPASCYVAQMLMAIFDKSFIHSITAEEAAVFDMHFMSNLTPLFFVEVLADLEKFGLDDEEARAALVRSLAGKTPSTRSYPNMPHHEMALHELLGHPIEMRGVPLVAGGRRVQSAEGLGTVFEHPPEMKAASRWSEGIFGEEEYASARKWRELLRRAPESLNVFTNGPGTRFSFKDLAAVKQYAEKIIDRDGVRFRNLRAALEIFQVPEHARPAIIARWKLEGGPKLSDFAPYARHIMLIDLFRTLAMASGHIDPDKSSNFADMAYLYYLPFCQAFVSGDKLHRRCVPLFLRKRQQFVWAHDLRTHLSQLAQDYLNDPLLPELGLFRLSGKMSFAPESFIGALFSRAGLGQRGSSDDRTGSLTPEAERALVERLTRAAEAPPPTPDADLSEEDVNTTIIRSIPLRRGRFPMMPRGVQ